MPTIGSARRETLSSSKVSGICVTTSLTRRSPVMDSTPLEVSFPSISEEVVRSKRKKKCKTMECQRLSKSIERRMEHMLEYGLVQLFFIATTGALFQLQQLQ